MREEEESFGLFGSGTRGRLLRAMASAVARKGVRALTVQDALDAAQVSRRTFYKHFDSLEDALDGLFEVTTAVLPATIEVAVSMTDDPHEQLVRAIDAFLNLQQIGGRLIVELQAEAIRPDSLLAPRREAIIADLVSRFTAALPQADPLLLRGLIYAIEGLVIHAHLGADEPPADGFAHIRRVVVPMLARLLGA